jgi:methylaspartate mutase epsilon subunit
VEDVRNLIKAFDLPVELRAYGPDLRLVAETGFATGYSAFTGNPLYIAANYTSNQPLESVYRNWQYIYRLVGEYELRGVPILAEIKPLAAGVPLPPALNVASIVLDLLVAISQGVRNIGWVNRPQGNFAQTAAVARSVRSLANRYLPEDEVELYQLGSHWNGVWPDAAEQNHTVMALNAVEVILAGAIELYVKTPAEGESLPGVVETVTSVRSTEMVIEVLKEQAYPVDERVRKEAKRIETTANAIVDAALEAGSGSPVQGSLAAISEGLIDVPYPTSSEFSGSVRVARDEQNAVRFSEVGAVPVPKEIRSHHEDKLDEMPSESTVREQMLEAMHLFR